MSLGGFLGHRMFMIFTINIGYHWPVLLGVIGAFWLYVAGEYVACPR